MRNHLSRIILIFAAVILSLYFLYPTYEDYQHRQQLESLSGADSLKYLEDNEADIVAARLKRMKLGLDLQGGMRVVLEVDVLQLLEDVAKNKDENFTSVMQAVRGETQSTDESLIPVLAAEFQERGIRMSRYYGSIRDDDDAIVSQLSDETEKAIDRAIEIVRNRVDQYRVSEPNIQKQGSKRIIVELPGVKDETEVRQLLEGTAKLEFRLLKDPALTYRVMESIDKLLLSKGGTGTTPAAQSTPLRDTTQKDALSELTGTAAADTASDLQFAQEHPFFALVRIDNSAVGFVDEKDRDRVRRILEREEVRSLLPPDFEFLWSAKPIKNDQGINFYNLYGVRSQPELTGGVIVDARASVDPENNRPIVNMEMNSEGSSEWARITGANINKRIAIAMDNSIFSAPNVEQKIVGGRSRITGLDSPAEARLLEIVLRAGALPAPVDIVEQRAVGASLGEDSIRSGLTATTVALLFTVLFMVVYYNTAGSVADIALVFNMLFILGVLAGFQATLTLPGIAGIILTIGMAVDANVLINERVREELAGGKTLRAAIDAGYDKAFSAILDSNITTFLTGLILYQFGSGPVQGFALTLMIGIAATMFSALLITRLIFNLLTDRNISPNFG
ncbi:MAG: protein translocase subunit SecD [Ignavibacteriae bacterium]|nr:protein translocase subunit SecD [Ignavibacteriota bacterium]